MWVDELRIFRIGGSGKVTGRNHCHTRKYNGKDGRHLGLFPPTWDNPGLAKRRGEGKRGGENEGGEKERSNKPSIPTLTKILYSSGSSGSSNV